MPRGYRPVCRTGRGDIETDSARRTSARRPTAIAQDLCRAWCDAWPATARCDARATRAGWLPRRNPGRRARRPAGTGVGRVRLAAAELRRSGRGLLASRSDWRRSRGPQAECLGHHKCRLLPRFARSVGFGPVFAPPHIARTRQLSMMARDQSMSPSSASQFKSAKCI